MAKRPQQAKPAGTVEKSPPETFDNQIATEIERQIGPLISGRQREEIVSRVIGVVMSERFSGPMPHPRHLAHYEEILPGSAERIMAMAEKAQNHNSDMEERIVSAQISDQKRGMYFGLASLLVILGLAAWMALIGNNAATGLFLGTAVIGTVAAFIKGRF